MEKCNFLKILQCPDFENLWGDFWHLFQPKKLDESDGGFFFLRIIFSSNVHANPKYEINVECIKSARFCVNKHLLQLVSHGVSSVETPREIVLLKLVFNKVDSHYIWSIVLVPFSIFFSFDFSGCWEICSSTGCSSWKGERSSAWDPHQHQGEQFRHLESRSLTCLRNLFQGMLRCGGYLQYRRLCNSGQNPGAYYPLQLSSLNSKWHYSIK